MFQMNTTAVFQSLKLKTSWASKFIRFEPITSCGAKHLLLDRNRRVAFRLCFEASPSAKPFIWKLVLLTRKFCFIYMWIKLISIRKASYLDSPWNRGERQLRNRLLQSDWLRDRRWYSVQYTRPNNACASLFWQACITRFQTPPILLVYFRKCWVWRK